MRSKKPRINYRKGQKTRRWQVLLRRIALGVKGLASLVALAAATGFFILVYEFLIQCDYFTIAEVSVGGNRRLTTEQVARQARVRKGDNILSVNLELARKRLLTHPWIAEAEVSREIPYRLLIRITEHTPLAVVDLGRKFLINQQGHVFKEWDSADQLDLPVISGLDLADLKVHGYPEKPAPEQTPVDSAPFRAVMQVLELGNQQRSVLPNHLIRQISVDRQIGLTIFAFDRLTAIKLGYSDYDGKYLMLAKLFSFLKRQQSIFDFDRIDLNNLQRIVINPIKTESRTTGP